MEYFPTCCSPVKPKNPRPEDHSIPYVRVDLWAATPKNPRPEDYSIPYFPTCCSPVKPKNPRPEDHSIPYVRVDLWAAAPKNPRPEDYSIPYFPTCCSPVKPKNPRPEDHSIPYVRVDLWAAAPKNPRPEDYSIPYFPTCCSPVKPKNPRPEDHSIPYVRVDLWAVTPKKPRPEDYLAYPYFPLYSEMDDKDDDFLFRNQPYIQYTSDFSKFLRSLQLGAATYDADKLYEVLDVCNCLKRTLELVRKEMRIRKIQELGHETKVNTTHSAKFRERLEPNREKCPPHVMQVIEGELTYLQLLEASSSEFNVTCSYLDWLTALPWGKYSDENHDHIRAQKILDEDHYGLTDVKQTLLGYVHGNIQAQGKIICLCGPPGVGKTSIARSIARARNCKFFQFSVGGLSNVAAIKGRHRTYVGAMPGKMVKCLKNVGTANPVVLINEIDKLGTGRAGDLAGALLELLDPRQNANFLDHYLDVPIDLSKVPFVCSANVVDNIPNPLLDRMEVIYVTGYNTDEKMHIAREYLEKTAREDLGIKSEQVQVTDAALRALIEKYCIEAGVQNLQKHIEMIYRKIALQLVGQGKLIEFAVDGEVVEANEVDDTVQTDDQIRGPADQPSDSKDTVEAENIQESEATKTVEKVLVVDISNLTDFVGELVFRDERL